MLEQLITDIAAYTTQTGKTPGFILMDKETLEELLKEDGFYRVTDPKVQFLLNFNYRVPAMTNPHLEFLYVYGIPIIRSQDITGYLLSAPSLVLSRRNKSAFQIPGQEWSQS